MKIAIGKKELEKNNDLKQLYNFDKDNDYIIIDDENFDINDIRKEWINIIITSNSKLINEIYNSISLSSSTYVISDKNTLIQNPTNHFAVDNLDINNIVLTINSIKENRLPSKEKIWNRYYTDEQLLSKFPEMTQTDYLRSLKHDPNLCAYEYFGQRTSHLEHNHNVIDYAGKLAALGIKKGDFVSICMPNTPELVSLKYCLEDMGCTANFIDPRADSDTILHCLNTGNSKYLFILDSKYKELNSIIDKTNLDKVYLFTPFESINIKNSMFGLKKLYDLGQLKEGNRPKDSGYGYFKDFMKIVPTHYEKAEYDPNHITSIQYTSGTTGKPKPVMLNGNSFNSRVHSYQYDESEIILRKGDRLLQALPISGLAFGEYAIQMGLCKGMENVIVPSFSPEELGKMLYENKINAFVMPPLAMYKILDSEYFDKLDLENMRMIAIGGESMSSTKVNEINKMLEEKNCPVHVVMGGGCTEGVVCNTTVTYNIDKPGSAGIPLLGNELKIKDKAGKELSYNERGYIYYNPVNPMLGYYNMPELTKKVKTEDGVNLGDIGEIDENGLLTYIGRDSQMIKLGDKIIYPRDIEEEICKLDGVDFCTVTGKNGEIRVFYTLKDGYNIHELSNRINAELKYKFKDIYNNMKVIALNNMPFTKNCKTDREKLAGNIEELDLYTPNVKVKKIKK